MKSKLEKNKETSRSIQAALDSLDVDELASGADIFGFTSNPFDHASFWEEEDLRISLMRYAVFFYDAQHTRLVYTQRRCRRSMGST